MLITKNSVSYSALYVEHFIIKTKEMIIIAAVELLVKNNKLR
jgi:hypothetical protein